MPTGERRTFERFAVKFPVRFRNTSPDYGVDVFLKDFSGSGLRLTTRQRMFIDDVVSLEVKMPDDKSSLMLNGRARWVRPVMGGLWEVGIEYHRVDFLKMHRMVSFALAAQNN